MLIVLNQILVQVISFFYVILDNKYSTMRKIIIIIVIVFIDIQCFSETLDSLKSKRESLYQKYSEINIPGKELSDKDQKKVIEILKDLVIIDTRIIKEYGASDKQLKEDAAKIKQLTTDKEDLKRESERVSDYLFIIYIVGGVIVSILVLLLIFLVIYFSKYHNLKKKNHVYTDMLKESDNDRLKISKLNELITLKEQELEKQELLIQRMKNDELTLKEKIKKLEESVVELQKTHQNTSSEYNDQIEKVNINISKIEKLGRMKDLGIVTEEEFNAFKQKFLSEM